MMPDVAQKQRGIENFEHVAAEIRIEGLHTILESFLFRRHDELG